MHEPLKHTITVLSQMDIDLNRIGAAANEMQKGLVADCCEQRIRMLSNLRMIRRLATFKQETESRDMTPIGKKVRDRDRYEANAKAGDFSDDINPVSDKDYLTHVTVSDNSALAEYRLRVNRIGWILAATGAGVLLALGKIIFTLIS